MADCFVVVPRELNDLELFAPATIVNTIEDDPSADADVLVQPLGNPVWTSPIRVRVKLFDSREAALAGAQAVFGSYLRTDVVYAATREVGPRQRPPVHTTGGGAGMKKEIDL